MRSPTGKTITFVLCVASIELTTNGCALTSKAEFVETRYFSPERTKPQVVGESPGGALAEAAPNAPLELRLGRVSSGSNLRERIAYRDATYELGYYDELRWAERPETYVRRGLGRALFEVHGFHRAITGEAPTLDVELIAFDDLRLSTGRAVRVQLRIMLYEERGVLLEETLTINRAVAEENPKISDVIGALANALEAVTEQVVSKVQKELVARGRTPPQPDVAQ